MSILQPRFQPCLCFFQVDIRYANLLEPELVTPATDFFDKAPQRFMIVMAMGVQE